MPYLQKDSCLINFRCMHGFSTNSQNMHYFTKFQDWCELKFLLSDIKFMNTFSFTISSKKLTVCSKVFVECIICLGELEEFSSSSSSFV